ncbi:class I mannose-6-phosphate isomerase [Desulfovibrio sp. OttesenSCG-928-I05]|nr:class I mannose-6-phosphate isomerase [Desulfovibrio sp. OttesenSCG-928-I05]
MTDFLPPILLSPVYVTRAWGGLPLLRDLHPDAPEGLVGESWDISCYPSADCVMRSGPRAGEALSALLRESGEAILGREWTGFNDFPLLHKFLAPLRDLPLQVHPADDYALRVEGQNGKTECWYILDCEPDAAVWLGLEGVRDREELAAIVRRGEIARHARRVPVRRGDVVYIPSGMVHGLGTGCLAYEVQQNSDVTYRLDDFGLGIDGPEARAEHLRKGLDVIDFEANVAAPGIAANWDDGDGWLDCSPFFGLGQKSDAKRRHMNSLLAVVGIGSYVTKASTI